MIVFGKRHFKYLKCFFFVVCKVYPNLIVLVTVDVNVQPLAEIMKSYYAGVTSLGQTTLLSFGCSSDIPFRYNMMENGGWHKKILPAVYD